MNPICPVSPCSSHSRNVLRRLAEGIDELLDGLPETSAGQAALKHSYPDWIAETWWRDLGESAALEWSGPGTRPATNGPGRP